MCCEPTLEEMEALVIPSVQKVVGSSYKYRKVYVHLLHDEEEYFIGGFDPDKRQIVAYEVFLDRKDNYYGYWGRRRDFYGLLERTSTNGAKLVWNRSFVPRRATTVPKIQACDRQWSRMTQSDGEASI
ncbi:hypothetical protein [Bythopirellula polymerisocia]|uniref:Uncharacterized protein n=1 Tax=Bythopirellula polymerisocia TaxID=2528003 RepID=A0A5C6C9L7_9BACT|nr:hypothetical protein [Bythopirellula polymerisocia]TWU21423.1 hypothetical protein Pla144_46450 [Bythopirellula polymerisocia]